MAVDVGALAALVRERAPGGPLDQVEAALAMGAELTSGADDLIGQFVVSAREAGCTWTEIGERMGVTKQAARQKYMPVSARPARRRRARGRAAGAAACSFCGKPRTDVLRLVAGPGVYICAECIGLCTEILAEPAREGG